MLIGYPLFTGEEYELVCTGHRKMPIDARINNMNDVEKEFLLALFQMDSKRRLGYMPQEEESFVYDLQLLHRF